MIQATTRLGFNLREFLWYIPLILFIGSVAYGYGISSSEKAPHVLGPYRQADINSHVEGIDGPAVRLGDSAMVEAEICNNKETTTNMSIFFRKLGNGDSRPAQLFINLGPLHREAGCFPLRLNVPMPNTPEAIGRYNIYGVDVVTQTNESLIWTSEVFRVVP